MDTSDYGLTASVWAHDLEAGETLLKQLEAGTVFINRCDYSSSVSIIIEPGNMNITNLLH